MKRDKNGRFSKEQNDGYKILLEIPSIKKMIYWLLFLIILLPWLVIGSRFNLITKIFDFLKKIMQKQNEEEEQPKKNGLFY